jgi:hypothetical protein
LSKSSERTPAPSTSHEAKQNDRFVYKDGDVLKVICRHCGFKTSDGSAYKTHLATQGHTASLRGLKMKLANKIGLIRNTQRRSQNRLTKQMEIDGSIFDEQGERKPTLFCKLCKLIFSQDRQLHNESVEHKAIYQFLNPNCQVNIFFHYILVLGVRIETTYTNFLSVALQFANPQNSQPKSGGVV